MVNDTRTCVKGIRLIDGETLPFNDLVNGK